ncbi:MAG: hypothetical protein ACLSCV_09400 [Acutalibacteraceae bacterium]
MGAPCTYVLVISCPCALVISIPLGFWRNWRCIEMGVLVKGSNYLEALASKWLCLIKQERLQKVRSK